MSSVAVWTDKDGGRIVKGTRAEEEHLLIGVLSGCAVKNCMSVTEREFR